MEGGERDSVKDDLMIDAEIMQILRCCKRFKC